MQVFLGDQVTLVNDKHDEEQPTFITGQVKGIVLNEHKKIERIYLHNLSESLWMSDGWKFVDDEEIVSEDD
jgi:hypothetical protein